MYPKTIAASACPASASQFRSLVDTRAYIAAFILQGDRDPFYPLQISVDMAAAIPHAALWIVRGGGHAPISGERWPEFLQTAAEFLRQ